ncbi:MAG: YciI family protein [Candidatus Binatia bacterium]
MKDLCLAYKSEDIFHAMDAREWESLRTETLSYVDSLRESGHLLVTHALRSARTAATVRVRREQMSMTDGAFAETKEQLGGFFLIEARDLNEAIQLAARWPSARLGSIEMRPIEEELPSETRYI